MPLLLSLHKCPRHTFTLPLSAAMSDDIQSEEAEHNVGLMYVNTANAAKASCTSMAAECVAACQTSDSGCISWLFLAP